MSVIDIHAPYLIPLVDADDWGALVRYWIAHQHTPALDAAIAAAQRIAKNNQRWMELPSFLKQVHADPMGVGNKAPQALLELAEGVNALTLYILSLFPQVILCSIAGRFPMEYQEQLISLGLKAAKKAYMLVLAAKDQALSMFFICEFASGLYAIGQTEQAVEAWGSSLGVYRGLAQHCPEVYKPDVAKTLGNLSVALHDLKNLSAARNSFEEALSVYRELAQKRPEIYRPNLAKVLQNLGGPLFGLKDLKATQDSLREALSVYRDLAQQRPDLYRFEVAKTLSDLGMVEHDLKNLETARDGLKEALGIYAELVRERPDFYRPYVANTLHHLGCVQNDLKELRAALDYKTKALELFRELARERPEVYRDSLIAILNDLGNTQLGLKETEAALGSYREALDIFPELDHKQLDIELATMAVTLNNLGNAQHDLNKLEAALDSFQQALEILRKLACKQPEAHRPNMAMTLNNLGAVQSDLNDLKTAFDSYKRSLGLYRELALEQPEEYQPEVAMALNNLGNKQRELNDLEAARNSFQESLLIRRALAQQRPEVYRSKVAATLNNLGLVQQRLNDIELAHDSHKDALEIYRELARKQPEVYLPDVAMTLSNFGNTQLRLNEQEAACISHATALKLYRELARHRPDVYRIGIAKTAHDLGIAQLELKRFKAARESLQKSLNVFRDLERQRPETYQSDMASTLNVLGNVHLHLKDLEAARQSYEEASRLIEADPMTRFGARLLERRMIWTNLGLLYRISEDSHWPDYGVARDALRRAVNCAEDFRSRLHDPILRNGIFGNMFDPYEILLRTCLDLWDTAHDFSALDEAVFVAEQSRSRNLMEWLTEEELAPRNAPPERFADFLRLRRQLQVAQVALERRKSARRLNPLPTVPDDQKMHARNAIVSAKEFGTLRRLLRGTQSLGGLTISAEEELSAPVDTVEVIAKAETRIAALANDLREADPEWNPDRAVNPLTSIEIQALIPTDVPTAFVQFTLTVDTGFALVLTRESIECVQLPKLSEAACLDAVHEWFRAYYNRVEQSYDWENGIDNRLLPIGAALQPLWSALEALSIQRAILSPNRWLHIFPLHACLLADGRQRVADAFEISYTPSFSILGRCASRTRAQSGPVLIVGNPTNDLDFTESEVAMAIRRYPGAQVLDYPLATKSAIFAEAPGSWLFFYTGHAMFDVQNPMFSSLILETKDQRQRAKWLSLGDAFCHLNLGQCSLAILNGCESGLLLPDRNDEYLALASGFLHAGAKCVISTLWAVHDLSAALLMDRFHAEWRSGKSVAAALREAARWLREDIESGSDLLERILPDFLREIPKGSVLYNACVERAHEYATHAGDHPPFESPAYWAAFTAVGKAW